MWTKGTLIDNNNCLCVGFPQINPSNWKWVKLLIRIKLIIMLFYSLQRIPYTLPFYKLIMSTVHNVSSNRLTPSHQEKAPSPGEAPVSLMIAHHTMQP